MFRVNYNNESYEGTLVCPFCGGSFPLPGNVRTFTRDDGNTTTYPDARNVVHCHFHRDDNSFIPVCTAPVKPGTTAWQAITETGDIVARGRVIIEQVDNIIRAPHIVTD